MSRDHFVICPHCHGDGTSHDYKLFDTSERKEIPCSEEEWWDAPDDEDDAYEAGERYCKAIDEDCPYCNGTGYVESEEYKNRFRKSDLTLDYERD